MRVLLLRNLHEATLNISMKLYADRLTAALSGQCEIRSARPWTPPSFPAWMKPVSKGIDYVVRYAQYPVQLVGETADVYHIVDHAYSQLITSLPRRRTIITCHDLIMLKLLRGEFPQVPQSSAVAARLFQFSVSFLRNAERIVAMSHTTADDVVRHLGIERSRISVVYSGVDPLFRPPASDQDRRDLAARLGFGGRTVLLHVGNNWFYKNVEGLLRAFAMMSNRQGSARPLLVKVGKKLTPAQEELARSLGIVQDVLEVGPLDPPALQAYYWAADALVFPSWWEGFGWPPLEAMASGTPVVCSTGGSLGEVVADAAELVPAGDPEAVAQGITRVLDNPARQADLRRRGLERVKSFTMERMAQEMLKIYTEIAGSANRQARAAAAD